MKKYIPVLTILLTLVFSECKADNPGDPGTKSTAANSVIQLSDDGFKKMIFNYEVNKEWKYEGTKPAIIDFYATWCPPCKKLSPLLEDLAVKYKGKIVVYKVDVDAEQQLAQSMGISSMPTLLFIPVSGQPQQSVGLVPNETLEKMIHEILLVK